MNYDRIQTSSRRGENDDDYDYDYNDTINRRRVIRD